MKIIRVDADAQELDRYERPAIGLCGDAGAVARALLDAVPAHNRARPSRRDELLGLRAKVHAQLAFLQPQMGYLQAIRDELPEDGVFVDELTQLGYAGRLLFPVLQPRGFISPGYQGTLGWGVATALGVKVARPDRKVVAVSGDGGFLLNAQELATAVQQRIPVVIVLVNDNAYGNVRRIQATRYRQPPDRVGPAQARLPEIRRQLWRAGVEGVLARRIALCPAHGVEGRCARGDRGSGGSNARSVGHAAPAAQPSAQGLTGGAISAGLDVPVCRGLLVLPPDVLGPLLRSCQVVALPAGHQGVRAGAGAESFLLLLEGTLRVQQVSEQGREIVLYRVSAGESCALTTACLMGFEDYLAEAVTETAISAVAIPRATFDTLVAQSPEFRRFVFTAFSRRVTDLFRVIEDVAFPYGHPSGTEAAGPVGGARSDHGDATAACRRTRHRTRSREPRADRIPPSRVGGADPREHRHCQPRRAAAGGKSRPERDNVTDLTGPTA